MRYHTMKRVLKIHALGLFVFIFLIVFATQSAFASAPLSQLKMVSVPNDGVVSYPNAAPDVSPPLSISDDGRYIVFSTDASNFVSDSTRDYVAVYLYDTQANTYTLVSKSFDGSPIDGNSTDAVISGNGRYIAYRSFMNNLVTDDANDSSLSDVFLYDRQTDTTRLITLNDASEQANGNSSHISISNDGRYVAFTSDSTNLVPNDTNSSNDAFVYDTQTNTIKRISVTDTGAELSSGSDNITLAAGGGYAAFYTNEADVISGDTNAHNDIFVYDLTQDTVERVSVADDGTQGDDDSNNPSLSSDGRYIAFQSDATNLVAGDTNSASDVFVHDRQTHTTKRVSIATDGTEGNGDSNINEISSDGTKVLFMTIATNFAPGVTNLHLETYMRDLGGNTTTKVSVAPDATESDNDSIDAKMSSDGRYVVFNSLAKTLVDGDSNKPDRHWTTYYKDTQANTLIELMAPTGVHASGDVGFSDISSTGRYIVFSTSADNLVTRDGNGYGDVFVYDRQSDTVQRVSVASDGTEGNDFSSRGSITSDGRYVVFNSEATNFTTGLTTQNYMYVTDRQTGGISYIADGVTSNPMIAAGGRYVVFQSNSSSLVPGDTNDETDIFVYDMNADSFERVSIASDGTQANNFSSFPTISADGRYVAFYSPANNLVMGDTNNQTDTFIYDRQTHTIERVSIANDGTQADGGGGDSGTNPSISDDGRYVVFDSYATNLVPNDTNDGQDIFVFDRQTHTITRVSVANDGTEANDVSYFPKISSDGRYISFVSSATNLVPDDENENDDIFLYDQTEHTITRLTTNPDGSETDGYSYGAISGDGNWLGIESEATELTNIPTDGIVNVYSAHIGGSAPVISSVAATPSNTSATITWTTDTNSSSSVSYGSTTGYGSTGTGTGGITSHTVSISGLSRCTTYHFTVTSMDSGDNSTTSSDATFTTTGCSSGGGGGGSSGSVPIKPTQPTDPSSSNACVPTVSILTKTTLQRGMRDDLVGMIQQFLQTYGYYIGKIDKTYGPKTEAAVRSFQVAQHMLPTGIWDKAAGNAGDLMLQCKTQQSITLPPASTSYAFTHDLKLGMRDADVLKLQQYLNTHGAVVAPTGLGAPGMETTYFGQRTKQALAIFQREHGIVPSVGFFGPITRAYVNSH